MDLPVTSRKAEPLRNSIASFKLRHWGKLAGCWDNFVLSSPSEDRLSDARVRSRYRLPSTFSSLRRVVLGRYRRSELRLVPSEICSCRQRIRQGLKTKIYWTGLCFEPVYLSLPTLSDYDSRIERQPYILGIQALTKERPCLTLSDLELFLQEWFRAEKCVPDILGTESEIPVSLW